MKRVSAMGTYQRRSRGGSKDGESTRSRQSGRVDDLQSSRVRERSGTNTAPAKSNLKTDHKNPEVPTHIGRENFRSLCRSKMKAADDSRLGETRVPDSVRDVVSSPGSTLDGSIQRAMEDRMGDDLGDVRVHTGPQAANACDDINARAFTVGNHVAFNSGEYDPESAEGQHVLAHELVHVRQQTGGAVSMLPQKDVGLEIDPDPTLEREAEETAQRVMEGGELGIHRMRNTEVHVQRMGDSRDRDATANETRTEIAVEYRESTDVDIEVPDKQLQSKFKHADDFGINETWNSETAEKFKRAILNHIHHPDTIILEGTYHDQSAKHVYNCDTKNNVILRPDGEFWTCWNLSTPQEKHLLQTGDL